MTARAAASLAAASLPNARSTHSIHAECAIDRLAWGMAWGLAWGLAGAWPGGGGG